MNDPFPANALPVEDVPIEDVVDEPHIEYGAVIPHSHTLPKQHALKRYKRKGKDAQPSLPKGNTQQKFVQG